ncbi:MAG: MTH938/NDUFAF3 family protein [Actinomycetota bacterium]
MTIEEYSFGRVVVDGREERRDLIITASGIRSNWWRKEGHSLSMEDLDAVIEAEPEVLVVGTGADGNMRPVTGLAKDLRALGIEAEFLATLDAVNRFNELLGVRNVAAALHLTC